MKILAPAGSEDVVYAAFDSGADAVYVAPADWSRRVSKYCLDDEAMIRCIDYANAHGKELRIPLNAYFHKADLSKLLGKIEKYVKHNVTGIIAADLALIDAVRTNFPDTKIYISAAAGVSNVEKALFFKDMGACEIVAPYNLTPDEMQRIRFQADIGVEAFAHGHYDFNQCGHCWMSTYFHRAVFDQATDRQYVVGSLNRGGGCFHVCRTGWDLKDARGATVRHDDLQEGDRFYFYYSVDRLGKYAEAGVTSLKIMGRSYSKEFVIRITKLYREMVDEVMKDPANFQPTEFQVNEAKAIEALRSAEWDEGTGKLLAQTPLEYRMPAHA
jgi:putative protease